MLNLSSQENKSDFGEGRGGKNREKKGNRKSPQQKKPPRSPTAMPLLLPRPKGSKRSIPAGRRGRGGSLLGGPFRLPGPAAAPGTAAGRAERLSLLEAAAAQATSGRRIWGGRDEQSLNELLGQVSERNRSLLAGGGGQGGQLGDIQNKATAPMK